MNAADTIRLTDVSKFYGDVLGVNRVDLVIEPGLTGLVGPNGAGKSTLMNLMTGLVRPSRGTIRVLGIEPTAPEDLFRHVGFCGQWDTFPPGATARSLLEDTLRLHGVSRRNATIRAGESLDRVGLSAHAGRRVAAFSKGMKQRLKLAFALCHDPRVLILDEPLNGLDPQGRAEVMEIFKALSRDDRIVVVSSHILKEVDVISDAVVMMHEGRVLAEGAIREVRDEIVDRPVQFLIRCDRPQRVAACAFSMDHVVGARLLDQGGGVLVSTRNGRDFARGFASIVLDEGLAVETIIPADEDILAVYDYLIGPDGGVS